MLPQVGLIVILLASSEASSYYITPSDDIIAGNNTCFFQERVLQPCNTLKTLATNHTISPIHNHDENSTFSFLPGIYVVRNNTYLNFTSFQEITFTPLNASTIKINCNAEMTITFRNVSVAIVRSLQFHSFDGKSRRGHVIKFFIMLNTIVQILNSSFTGTHNRSSINIFSPSDIEVKLTITGSKFISNRTFAIRASSPNAIRITEYISDNIFSYGTHLIHKSQSTINHSYSWFTCNGSFSVPLGSDSCIDCSNNTKKYNFLWLVPLFAVMGLILVLTILFLDLTVSIGLINGLIFYANILSISGLINNCYIHPLLSVFISWINLDFGIKICFYSGMDMHQKTWLQFAFPLYIWLLVGLIVILSHYSIRVTRLLGRKVIPVLATLFLLSYAKILKIIFMTFMLYYNGSKHIPLFIVALLFLVLLFLPYTLLLTFGQCFRSLPRRKGLRWLQNRAFISMMDAYHAPFNRKHRYWIGFLLWTYVCSQCLLFIIHYKISNIFTITIVIMLLLLLKASIKEGIYRNYLVNTFDNIFMTNLGLLAATAYYLEGDTVYYLEGDTLCYLEGDTFYYLERDNRVCTCITASISVAFVMFLAIITYHIYYKMKGYNVLRRFIHEITVSRRVKVVQKTQSEDTPTVTSTIVELREALLETENS